MATIVSSAKYICVASQQPTGFEDRMIVNVEGEFQDCQDLEPFDGIDVSAADLLAILSAVLGSCSGMSLEDLAQDLHAKVQGAIDDVGFEGLYYVMIGNSEVTNGGWSEVPDKLSAHVVKVVDVSGTPTVLFVGAAQGKSSRCPSTGGEYGWIELSFVVEHAFDYCAEEPIDVS